MSKSFAAQVINALNACHDAGVAHLDVKPENLCMHGAPPTMEPPSPSRGDRHPATVYGIGRSPLATGGGGIGECADIETGGGGLGSNLGSPGGIGGGGIGSGIGGGIGAPMNGGGGGIALSKPDSPSRASSSHQASHHTSYHAPRAPASADDFRLTAEEKAQLKGNFDSIDANGSGALDRSEFKAAMELAFAKHPNKPPMPSDAALEEEFNKCDTDGNGTIELDEFYEVFAKTKRGEDGGLLGKMGGGFSTVTGNKFTWTPFQFAWDLRDAVAEEDEKRRLVLIDFGMARPLPTGPLGWDSLVELQGATGSSSYAAPEVLRGQGNHLSDAWSVGVLLHVMLTGRTPWRQRKGHESTNEYLQGVEQQVAAGQFDVRDTMGEVRRDKTKRQRACVCIH